MHQLIKDTEREVKADIQNSQKKLTLISKSTIMFDKKSPVKKKNPLEYKKDKIFMRLSSVDHTNFSSAFGFDKANFNVDENFI